MDAAAEHGGNLVSKHQLQPEYGGEQADAGRDCRNRLARDQVLRRERGQGNIHFSVQLTTSRIGDLTRLVLTLAICDGHTHTYIHQMVKSK